MLKREDCKSATMTFTITIGPNFLAAEGPRTCPQRCTENDWGLARALLLARLNTLLPPPSSSAPASIIQYNRILQATSVGSTRRLVFQLLHQIQ